MKQRPQLRSAPCVVHIAEHNQAVQPSYTAELHSRATQPSYTVKLQSRATQRKCTAELRLVNRQFFCFDLVSLCYVTGHSCRVGRSTGLAY